MLLLKEKVHWQWVSWLWGLVSNFLNRNLWTEEWRKHKKLHISCPNWTSIILERKKELGIVSLFHIGPLWKNNILLSWNVCFSSEIFPAGSTTTNVPAKISWMGWKWSINTHNSLKGATLCVIATGWRKRFADLNNFDDHQEREGEGEDDEDKREESQQMGTDSHTSFLAHFKYTLLVKLLISNDIQKGKWQIGIS